MRTRDASTVAARFRGVSVAASTTALACVAHAAAGGGAPAGSALALLTVGAVTLGGWAASVRGAVGVRGMAVLLVTGQVFGHVALGMDGHHHAVDLTVPMLAAHAGAVLVGAVLIATAGHLGVALSRAVRAASAWVQAAPVAAPPSVRAGSDQPLRWVLALAASTSHRGPPVQGAPLTRHLRPDISDPKDHT